MTRLYSMLVWIDLEMTGLNPEHDCILEIASLITTDNLDITAEGPQLVIHQDDETLLAMKEPVMEMHRSNKLFEDVQKSKISLEQAAAETLDFIKQNIPEPYSSPLCGNTVWMDRKFLTKYMPKIDKYLHYRCLDVSTVKELAKRWMGENFMEGAPKKPGVHRAYEDILYSVEELRYYRDNLFALRTSV